MGIRKINYTVIAPEVEQEIKDKYTKQETEAMLSDKVSNSRVLTDVPLNAKFTDTVYTHPSTHPASMITETPTRRFVSDDEKNTWNTVADKADKSYVDTELNKVYKKDEVFTKEEVLWKIEEIIDAAPEALDTLGELAEALDNDPNFATNIINLLSTKVDKVTGKQLSTEDYTTKEKSKLASIEDGANKYIHPSTHSLSMITETTDRKILTASERNKIAEVDNKVDKVSGKGLSDENYTLAEKNKLAGIATGATKNDTDANLKNRANHTGTQPSSTISDFASTVRNTVLTGLSTATNAAITATDTVLSALGKLQKQISDNLSTLTSHIGNKSNPHGTTKSHVGLGNVDNTSDKDKPISKATQAALDGKVDNSRVLTNVPINAKFTDTIYTHPSTHPASMITESTTKRFVSDTERTNWNKKAEISDIPTEMTPEYTAIPSNADLNNYTEIGFYGTANSSVGKTILNSPISGGFSLIVTKRGTFTNQTIIGSSTSSPNIWVRSWSSSWGNWYKVPFDRDIPTKLSQLTKNINFDERYYTKSETYTKTEVNTKLDEKVDNSRVLTDVPVNAKFTDTIYTHPASHPASMITESTTRRFVSDTEKANWNKKADKKYVDDNSGLIIP